MGSLGKHHARGLLNLKKYNFNRHRFKKCIKISNKLKKEYPEQQILSFKLDVTNEQSVKS